jgi:hypothetical protein
MTYTTSQKRRILLALVKEQLYYRSLTPSKERDSAIADFDEILEALKEEIGQDEQLRKLIGD